MKFRRLIFVLIAAACVLAFITKPSEDDFKKFIQPTVRRANAAPVVIYKDRFLYAQVEATFVQVGDGTSPVASMYKRSYIGLFNRFWEVR
ncbi:MAG: hypothetical protein QM727_05395 [Niabella sp.]